jgi:CheY-like chemotaxis protein
MSIENIAKSLKILIAEDDDINYVFIEYLFHDSKHKLTRALNGQEAIDLIKNSSDFDIIFMDLKMPVISGFEATRVIKNKFPELPVIAISAYVSQDDMKKAKESGCDDFIVKPYSIESLHKIIIKFV